MKKEIRNTLIKLAISFVPLLFLIIRYTSITNFASGKQIVFLWVLCFIYIIVSIVDMILFYKKSKKSQEKNTRKSFAKDILICMIIVIILNQIYKVLN